MPHDGRESEDDFGESDGIGAKVGRCEGYPSFWMHATIHLNPETGEMHSDGDHRVREWIVRHIQPPAPGAGMEGKYGLITTEKKKFHPGEPVFLLRGTDPLAPLAVRLYYELCMSQICSREHITAVAEHALRIAEWQREHRALVKDKPD